MCPDTDNLDGACQRGFIGVMTDATSSPNHRRWLAELRGIIGLLLLVFAIHGAIAKPFYIPSESMMPGLQVGDRLIVSRYPYGWSYASVPFHLLPPVPGRLAGRMPQLGDVVIVTPADAAHDGEDLIKRVVGLPGDTVQMVAGRLWLLIPTKPPPDSGMIAPPDSGMMSPPVSGPALAGFVCRCERGFRQAGGDDFTRRMLSPVRSRRWALWTSRSRMASA